MLRPDIVSGQVIYIAGLCSIPFTSTGTSGIGQAVCGPASWTTVVGQGVRYLLLIPPAGQEEGGVPAPAEAGVECRS